MGKSNTPTRHQTMTGLLVAGGLLILVFGFSVVLGLTDSVNLSMRWFRSSGQPPGWNKLRPVVG